MTLLELIPALGMVAGAVAGVGVVLWVEWGFWAECGVLLAGPVVGCFGTALVMVAVIELMILSERFAGPPDDTEE